MSGVRGSHGLHKGGLSSQNAACPGVPPPTLLCTDPSHNPMKGPPRAWGTAPPIKPGQETPPLDAPRSSRGASCLPPHCPEPCSEGPTAARLTLKEMVRGLERCRALLKVGEARVGEGASASASVLGVLTWTEQGVSHAGGQAAWSPRRPAHPSSRGGSRPALCSHPLPRLWGCSHRPRARPADRASGAGAFYKHLRLPWSLGLG